MRPVIRTALSEKGWLMPVLRDHQTDASFRRALALCARIYESLRLRTSDSFAPEWPEWPVVGTWQEFEDPIGDCLFNEIDSYCRFRRDLPKYTMSLVNRLLVASADTRLPEMCQGALLTI